MRSCPVAPAICELRAPRPTRFRVTPKTVTPSRRRVVVTGVGMVTPVGTNLDEVWQGLMSGVTAARAITRFDPEERGVPVRIACEAVGLDLAKYATAKEIRRLARVTQFAVMGGLGAVSASHAEDVDPFRSGVVVGTGLGGFETWEEQLTVGLKKGASRISPFVVPMVMPNASASMLAMKLGWRGPAICASLACAAGTHAIVEGTRLIRAGVLDLALVGGADALITPATLTGFWRAGALSKQTEQPTKASRPFDANRDGFVMGEGSSFMVIEAYQHAVRRRARILGEILGVAETNDAYSAVAPRPDAADSIRCMSIALADASVTPDQIRSVNAHGTSTQANDQTEAIAISSLVGDRTPVTAPKGVTGHMIGGSGALEAIVALTSANTGRVPPVANYSLPDKGIPPIDIAAGEGRGTEIGPVLSNSFAFGGHNVAIVVGPSDQWPDTLAEFR